MIDELLILRDEIFKISCNEGQNGLYLVNYNLTNNKKNCICVVPDVQSFFHNCLYNYQVAYWRYEKSESYLIEDAMLYAIEQTIKHIQELKIFEIEP